MSGGDRAGFTLVEVLVSLAIFALLAAAGTAVLARSIDTRFAVKAATERTADLQRLRSLLRADIGQAAPRRARGPTGRPMPQPMTGAGAPGEPVLTLVRAGWSNPGERPRPSLQRVEYRLVDGRLERRVSGHLDGSRPGPPQVLYRGVRDLSVSFVRDGAEAPAYLTTPERPLPDAVRLRMTLEGFGPMDQLFLVGGV
ncbi:MAG: type II secretion system minor pseudopilin GspJ [Brevundimonas sp.]|jgi:general secretion pathway protein J|uniref:type II secretion system minor pseudopilin GspJ n=1 Tax=Brevundimonas sp. TaxID=1871086 RepID=UPI0017F52BC8|nr:type II secretion system minor pseudopilin GspJ [Brevundimonas sp.]MBA4804831.1 type II secretion system minor pseudopilin GspJ [Brevundimonas sp.]